MDLRGVSPEWLFEVYTEFLKHSKKTRLVIFCDPENGCDETITENLVKSTSKIGRV
jgi:hypothetical protein